MAVKKEPTLLPYPAARPQAYRWLWLGVASFTVIIALLWGWSLKMQLAFFSWRASPESSLVNRARVEWNNIFSVQKTPAPATPPEVARLKALLWRQLNKPRAETNASSTKLPP